MQTYKYAGFVDCLKHTYKSEGLRGFFRGEHILFLNSRCVGPIVKHHLQLSESLTFEHSLGVTAPLASVTIVRTISFSIYQRAKYVYSDWMNRNVGFDVLKHVGTAGTYPNLWSVACFGAAGATAGSCITVIACAFYGLNLIWTPF